MSMKKLKKKTMSETGASRSEPVLCPMSSADRNFEADSVNLRVLKGKVCGVAHLTFGCWIINTEKVGNAAHI